MIEPTTLWIGQDHPYGWNLGFEVPGYASNRPSCTSTSNERINPPVALAENLGTCSIEMRLPIGLIFELIGKVTPARSIRVYRVLQCKSSCPIYKVRRIDDRYWWDTFNACSKFQKKV